MKKYAGQHNFIKNRKGFTMVELIVVLAILSILASVAVFSVIGYIDKSRFDNNEQNAQSIYQAVQTALGRKKNAGDVEDWIKNTLMKKGQQDPCDTGAHPNNDKDASGNILDDCFNATAFEQFDENHNSVGESVHMRYILSYQKGGNGEGNKAITDLVGGYFYDTSILNATFTIEFDVEKTIGGDRQVHYGVNTYAVFYDEKRTDWDEKALKESGNVVPWREYAYRSDTSLVGYYNGGNPAAVDSVYTPVVNKKMEFAELAMRNGEKLELSFSAIYDGKNLTGTGAGEGTDNYLHYTASIYDTSDDRWLADLVISEAYLTKGRPDGSQPVDYLSDLEFTPNSYGNGSVVTKNVGGKELPVVYTIDHMVDDTNAHFVRYKASVETTAMVYVNTSGHNDFDYNLLSANDLTDGKFYRFPLTISYVIRQYSETDQRKYVSYSIALDAMMSRNAELKNNNDKYLNYSIRRLLMDKSSPKNIRVSMVAAVDDFTDTDLAKYNFTENLPASESVNAKRAYDDPVYFAGDGRYVYKDPNKCDPEECATRDAAGYAVCNTFFGDLGYGSFGNKNDYVDIQENGKENKQQTASITSFRHLYNMRYTVDCKFENAEEVKPIVYEIRRDLDWYRKTENGFTSEVEVYNITNNYLTGYSPVGNSRGLSDQAHLKVVSWPALPVLSNNQILIAKENQVSESAGDKTAVIRNVQMRSKSFTTTDEGFGFICKNEGTLRNIRCENFCLTMENIADGTTEPKSVASTLARLFQHGDDVTDSFKDTNVCKLADKDAAINHYVPVGSLVGLQSGQLGIEDTSLQKEENTIRVSNPIVLVGVWDGDKWLKIRMYNKDGSSDSEIAGIGGAIGYYSANAKSSGTIETQGKFAVAGAYYIGGVIGNVQGGVDAHLAIDSGVQINGNAVDFPANVNCLVMGRKYIGGVAGYAVHSYFAQVIPSYGNGDIVEQISEQPDEAYGISVKLAKNSYIWQYGGYGTEVYEGIGGAVGQIKAYDSNKVLSIKSINEGYILSTKSYDEKNPNNNKLPSGRYVGGAVGYLQQGSAKELYICAENSGQIGTQEVNKVDDASLSVYGRSYAAAAGIAYINNFGTNGAVYRFDVSNTGYICCNADKKADGTGAGTAIGVYRSGPSGYPKLQINTINDGIIKVENTVTRNDAYWNSNQDYSFGAGGAAGYLYGMQNGSYVNSILKENAVVVSAGSNVGGAVGCIRNELKGTAASPIMISSSLNAGVQIKSLGLNSGGCIGNLRAQSDYCSVVAQVNGNASVYGYMNVGGAVGCGQQQGHGTGNVAGAIIQLQGVTGENGTPILSVKGWENYTTVKVDNKNIGGVVGVVGTYNGVYSTKILASAQSGNDQLITAIDGGQYVGGLVGSFYLNDLRGAGQHYGTASMDYVLNLHPQAKIAGVSQYVGGAIGYVYDQADGQSTTADFAVNLSVKIPTDATGNVVEGTNYIGGVIGAVNTPNMTGTVKGVIGAANAISGTALVGGAIGYTNIQALAGEIHSEIVATNAITASSSIQMNKDGAKGAFVGGCIGLVDGTATYTAITATYDGMGVADFSPIYGTNNYMGGCVGCIGGDDLAPQVQSVSTVVKGTAHLISAPENSMSGIGGVVGWIRKGSSVTDVRINQAKDANNEEIDSGIVLNLTKANYVGGVVGLISEDCRIGQLVGGIPVSIKANQNVGGLAGRVFDSLGIKEFSDEVVSVSQVGQVGLIKLTGGYPVDISAHSKAGGYVGTAQNAMLGTPSGNAVIKVSVSDKTAGGFFGAVDGVTIGTTNGEVVASQIQFVSANADGRRVPSNKTTFDDECNSVGGTGGFIGSMFSASKVNCSVNIELGENQKISGGWCIGGVVGYIEEGYMYGNLSVTLAGGQIQGKRGSVGGLIGSFQEGAAEDLSVYITGYYDNTSKESAAIGSGNTSSGGNADKDRGVGGVIGQIGGGDGSETSENRKTSVSLGSLTLSLGDACNEFAIVSGFSSMGGIIGQCETENATVKKMRIISQDGNYHNVRIEKSDAYDIGGIAGYFLGKLTEELFVDENIGINVVGMAYVGGCFGGMDGKLDAMMTIRGIKSVEGKGTYTNNSFTVSGVGGVIGAIGVWHGTGYIGERLTVDLRGTQITGKAATGGIIGCVGIRTGEYDAKFGTTFRAEITATFSDTTVNGTEWVGGLFGYIKEKYNWDDDSTMKLIVEGDSTIKARENTKSVGGMVGYNDAAFGSVTVLEIASGKTLTVFAQNGYAGGVIGTNNRVFSNKRTGMVEYPTGGGKLVIDVNNNKSGYVGAIIGRNTATAVSGRVKVDDNSIVYLSDMDNAVYDSDADLRGRHEDILPYTGFVGINEKKDGNTGEVYKVEMAEADNNADDTDAGGADSEDEETDIPLSDQDPVDEINEGKEYEEFYPSLETEDEFFEEDLPTEEFRPPAEGDVADEPGSFEDEPEESETESNGVPENVDELDIPEKEEFEEDTPRDITEPAA